jgi:hypothetical protein
MELIPILSTIILVATISTFILAIGAYILYKVREAKEVRTTVPKPAEVKGELVTPVAGQEQFPVYAEKSSGYASQRQPIFMSQEKQASQAKFTPQPQQYNAEKSKEAAVASKRSRVKSTGSKFLKYTSEGYVTPQEDNKKAGALKWR